MTYRQVINDKIRPRGIRYAWLHLGQSRTIESLINELFEAAFIALSPFDRVRRAHVSFAGLGALQQHLIISNREYYDRVTVTLEREANISISREFFHLLREVCESCHR